MPGRRRPFWFVGLVIPFDYFHLFTAEGEGFTFGDDITLQVFYHDDVTGKSCLVTGSGKSIPKMIVSAEQDGYQCADISFTSDHVMTVTCSNTSTSTFDS